jgi:hypothetical protein
MKTPLHSVESGNARARIDAGVGEIVPEHGCILRERSAAKQDRKRQQKDATNNRDFGHGIVRMSPEV